MKRFAPTTVLRVCKSAPTFYQPAGESTEGVLKPLAPLHKRRSPRDSLLLVTGIPLSAP